MEDFYIENYKKGIFIGTKYEKISKEDFEFCREFSTNKEAVKIFKGIFEENTNSFREFKDIASLLMDKSFWKEVKSVLNNEEEEVSLLKTKYITYHKVFSDNLYEIIFHKFYKNLENIDKEQINNIKNSIKKVFNSGDFKLDAEAKEYRRCLKKFIKK